jgi:hypothetical protein
MSLGIVINGPEGVVLAAESRVTLQAAEASGEQVHVNYDNATKLLSFNQPHSFFGVVTYGLTAIGLRTAYSYLPEFEAKLGETRLSVDEYATRLRDFFAEQWKTVMPTTYQGPSMTFVVAGFNEGEPYGKVVLFEIPGRPDVVEQNKGGFGITWGGQRGVVDRLIQGYDHQVIGILEKSFGFSSEQVQALTQALTIVQMRIPLQALPLQDCVDLAIFFVRTTIDAQRLTVGIRGCGGPIDVATITRSGGLKFVQRKQIVGEAGAVACPERKV